MTAMVVVRERAVLEMAMAVEVEAARAAVVMEVAMAAARMVVVVTVAETRAEEKAVADIQVSHRCTRLGMRVKGARCARLCLLVGGRCRIEVLSPSPRKSTHPRN